MHEKKLQKARMSLGPATVPSNLTEGINKLKKGQSQREFVNHAMREKGISEAQVGISQLALPK